MTWWLWVVVGFVVCAVVCAAYAAYAVRLPLTEAEKDELRRDVARERRIEAQDEAIHTLWGIEVVGDDRIPEGFVVDLSRDGEEE